MSRHLPPPTDDFLDDAEWSALAGVLGLSPRELEVVRNLFGDPTEHFIADRLAISPHTVHTHIERVFHKLDVRSRAGIIARCFEAYASMVSRGSLAASERSVRAWRRAA